MTELLERDTYLNQLDDALSEAASGSGRITLVFGEAGIGKTSVVETFVDRHRMSARIVWGRCDSLFTPQPLGPMYDIADRFAGEFSKLIQSAGSPLAIFAAFLRELQREPAPTIVVVEDVHWADAATLDLLKYVGRRLQNVRTLIVLTYRDDEIDRNHPLWSVVGHLPPSIVRRLAITPLSEAAVATLAGKAGRSARQVYALTGGNPFFVTEFLVGGHGQIPATIREATLARAARLSPAARALLDICAVAPNRSERWLLAATASPSQAAIDACASTGLLVAEGGALRFRHELARQAIESALPAAHGHALHARVLRALLDRGSDAVPVARIVHHAAAAMDDEAVRRFAPIAAREASALGDHRDAAAHYETALRHSHDADIGERAALFERLAYEAYLTGQIDAAIAARRGALALLRQQKRRAEEGANLRWLSRLAWLLGDRKEARKKSAEAIRILETLPPGPELAMAYSGRSQLHMLSNETHEAVQWGTRALTLAKRLSLLEVTIHALNNVGTAELMRGRARGWTMLERSLRLALEQDLHEHTARAYANLATLAVDQRLYDRARRYLEDGISYSNERDIDLWSHHMLGIRARANLDQGRWPDAAADAEAPFRQSRATVTRMDVLLVLGLLRVRRGDPGGDALLDEAHGLAARSGEIQHIGPTAAARAEAAWLKGQTERSLAEALYGYKLAVQHGDRLRVGELGYWVFRAGGRPHRVTRVASPFDHQARGDWKAAAAEWKRLGCPYHQALALTDGDSAAQLRALAVFEQLGAAPAAAIVRRNLRSQGVRTIPRGVRPATRRNPAGLTNREVEILRLLVGGLSNKAIAQQLGISAKTVDHHVSAVLAKLGVHSREDAAARARTELAPPK
jgi:predicted ATPase/DNA-binding CsgD family transcriptional regulator